MMLRHQLLLVFAVLLFTQVGVLEGQLRPISLPAIFSSIRYLNTACEGDNAQPGTCLYENDCLNRKGSVVGRCANGFASCCSFLFSCGGSTNLNASEFVNRNYPSFQNDTDTCQVTIEKLPNICQIRLDFDEFDIMGPDENGFCTTDSFMVRSTVGERLPILCGQNTGQHIYVDMGQGSNNPVVLSVVTNGNKALRKWKIRISMIPCNDLSMAPSGCLQYYRAPTDVIQSFNYGPKMEYRARYLANTKYTACIRANENFCAIRWETAEPGSFMFGAPFEGKDSEYGECSHPFPFFGMSGKTGEQGAPQTLQNITTSAKSAASPSSTISTSTTTSTTTTTTTTTTASTLSGRTPEANGGGDKDQASTLQPSSNRTGRIGSDSGSAAFPGINDNTKDALYPHRLCNGGASGALCNFDDFIGIDQGSIEGTGQGEDRFCGARLLDHDFIISRSKPFQLKVRSNGDHFSNAFNSQIGFKLKYSQLPCVI